MKIRLAVLLGLMSAVWLASCEESTGRGPNWDFDGGMDVEDLGVDDGSRDTADAVDVRDATDADETFDDGILQRDEVVGVWYSIPRLTDSPAITGTVQRVEFRASGRVEINRGDMVGNWEVFDEEDVRLFDLMRDGMSNSPNQYLLEGDFEEGVHRGFELFSGEGPSGQPYKLRYERAGAAVEIAEIAGEWQSIDRFENDAMDQFRIGLRIESSGKIGYGAITRGGYTEFARADGVLMTYDTGRTYWLIPPVTMSDQPSLAGEIRGIDSGSLQLWALRNLGSGRFEAIELEAVEAFEF